MSYWLGLAVPPRPVDLRLQFTADRTEPGAVVVTSADHPPHPIGQQAQIDGSRRFSIAPPDEGLVDGGHHDPMSRGVAAQHLVPQAKRHVATTEHTGVVDVVIPERTFEPTRPDPLEEGWVSLLQGDDVAAHQRPAQTCRCGMVLLTELISINGVIAVLLPS